MPPSLASFRTRRSVLRRVWLLVVALLAIAGSSSAVRAHVGVVAKPVEWDAGPDAPRVGLIGDSTLSGVRWVGRFGELERFSARFDAESCRRTVDTSCWSREQYRPQNALTVLRENAGGWGEVLVMMTGYNDSNETFADGVRAIVDEARRQGIGTVVWLSLRTAGVNYEEPLHRANGDTYRSANRALYALADEFEGYLQVADWASHSADRPEWFEADGAHLASPGVDALTSFIAGHLEVVLDGGTVTIDPPPWEDVRRGDQGEPVVQVQEALVKAGFGLFGEVDGVFGTQTWGSVGAFQRSVGLPDHGTVDRPTAIALGLTAPPASPPQTAATTTTSAAADAVVTPALREPTRTPVPVAVGRSAVVGGDDAGGDLGDALWVLLAISPAVMWLGYRWVDLRRHQARSSWHTSTASVGYDAADEAT